MVEECGSGLDRHGLLARIDEIPVLGSRGRRFAEAEDAVLGVEDRFASRRLEARDHLRQPNAEIDVSPVGDVLRGAPGDLRRRQARRCRFGGGRNGAHAATFG